ncbi:MAG: NADH-quinone oxidoreductase subunit C [Actinomycetota bacterium]|nr:NADH-quinone oxidoreductase subunit C [Actinomycetota bacterium]
MRLVPRDEWRTVLAALHASGLVYLDLLTAVERDAGLEVVARVVRPGSAAAEVIVAALPADDLRIDSAVPVYPGAAWHERETAEMFGIEFTGHPDPRPLLLRTGLGAPPLRKGTVLAARVVQPWPGEFEPSRPDRAGSPSRRRARPLGVLDGWPDEGGRP